MGDERYKLMFSGLAEGADAESVKASIQERFRMPLARIERWFGDNRAVIGDGLTRDQAWKTQYLFESVGVKTIVVQQPRSNLSLSNMQMETGPSRPAVTVSDFKPAGIVDFEARPLSQRPVGTYRRRRPASRTTERSFKLTHLVAAAALVVVCVYTGKQLMTEDSPMAHALASFSQDQ